MAPLLFAIYFQAANEVLTTVCPALSTLSFKTAKDFVFTGRKINQCATAIDFSFDKSLYADDKTKLADFQRKFGEESAADFCCFQAVWPRLSRRTQWFQI